MSRTFVGALVALALLAVAPPAQTNARPSDPSATGPFEVTTIDYDAQLEVVRAPTHAYPERLRGRIHLPTGGDGPHPVVLLVPGRHEACRVAGTDFSAGPVLIGPCPDAAPAIEDHPSWKGFDYLGRNLASNGYLVVTINTNAVNVLNPLDGTQERVYLIERTLEMLEEWNEGARLLPDNVGDALVDKVDLDRIGLMGHSRGADAVGYFLLQQQEAGNDAAFPGLRAVFELQGVDIPGANEAPAGTHFGALVGSCDADTGMRNVAPWERGRFLPSADRYARVLFHVAGANHNFFNREWYDEWDPPPTQPFPLNDYSANASCSASQKSNIRLARADQERIGLALVAAFMRRYVGGESAFQGLIEGSSDLPTSACPKDVYGDGKPLPCDEIVRTSYLAPARDRLVLLQPRNAPLASQGISASGFEDLSSCGGGRACPEPASASVAEQLVLSWDGPATLKIGTGKRAVDAMRFDALTFRTLMNGSSTLNDKVAKQDFEIVLIDSRGRSAAVRAGRYCCALQRPFADAGTPYEPVDPASGGYRSLHLNGIRIPLGDFDGVDLSRVVAVELRFGTSTKSGSIQLSELALQR